MVGDVAAAETLATQLREGNLADLSVSDIYLGAAELGAWALRQQDYESAQFAWSVAATYAEGAPLGQAFGFGRTRTLQAATIILDATGAHGGRRMRVDAANEAYAFLEDAQAALEPLAAVEAPNLELTVAQRAYAESRAWFSVLRAKMSSDGQRYPRDYETAEGDADSFTEVGAVDLRRPRCLLELNMNPRPEFPWRQQRRGQLAGVVLQLRVNEAGEIVETSTAARVGDIAFSESLEAVASRWTVTRREDSPANCRMESVVFRSFSFVLPSD
jgi:hypothetical protein